VYVYVCVYNKESARARAYETRESERAHSCVREGKIEGKGTKKYEQEKARERRRELVGDERGPSYKMS